MDDTLSKLVSATDVDNDGEITLTEFRDELLLLFDEDCKLKSLNFILQ